MSDWDRLNLQGRIDLVAGLLEEFGARHISLQGEEMHHSCVLPLGMHKNGDTSPSASINVRSLVMNCFVCGGGSLMWWVAVMRGTSVANARGWLETKQGESTRNLSDLLAFFDATYNPEREGASPLPSYSPNVLKPWLMIHPYMTEVRKIPVDTLKHFRIGFDLQTNRVVIPHFWKGKLVGWQTRRVVADGTPKFLNSPDFPKATTIWNYQPHRPVVLTEAVISVLSKWHVIPDLETTFSASVSERQLRQLASHPRVVLFYDNDEPGWKTTERVGEALIRHTDVRVVDNPWAADPADLTDDDFQKLVDNAVPFGIWRRPTSVVPYGDGDAESRD